MIYKTKRFSFTEDTQSAEIHESTINGKTKGIVVMSRGHNETGEKPVRKTIKIKYKKGGTNA